MGGTKKGIYLAVLVSSLLFGFAHIIHYFLHDESLLAAITQISYAVFIGVSFAAFVIRNKSIIPAIILHAIFDIAGSIKEISVIWKNL